MVPEPLFSRRVRNLSSRTHSAKWSISRANWSFLLSGRHFDFVFPHQLNAPGHALRCGPEPSATGSLRRRWFELSGHEKIYIQSPFETRWVRRRAGAVHGGDWSRPISVPRYGARWQSHMRSACNVAVNPSAPSKQKWRGSQQSTTAFRVQRATSTASVSTRT